MSQSYQIWMHRALHYSVLLSLVSTFTLILITVNKNCEVQQLLNEDRLVDVYYNNLLVQREEKHKAEISELRKKVKQLKQRVDGLSENHGEVWPVVENQHSLSDKLNSRHPEQHVVQDVVQQQQSNTNGRDREHHLTDLHLSPEYGSEPFQRFDMENVYILRRGYQDVSVIKMSGHVKAEFLEVLEHAIKELNSNLTTSSRVTKLHFTDGMFRTLQTIGKHYELFFRFPDANGTITFQRVTIFRPFQPLVSLKPAVTRHDINQAVNIVVPLKGREDALKRFLSNYVRQGLHGDKNVKLTVMSFANGTGHSDLLINATKERYPGLDIRVLRLSGDFSRGRALDLGVKSIERNGSLVFLCDVDIVFRRDFLSRCRMNTVQGQQVYFPIVFSFYNPKLVDNIEQKPQLRTHVDIINGSGFWREFGFGMACLYKSDFISVGGFNNTISIGWGREDVMFYKKFIRDANYTIVRSTDDSLLHTYHDKYCERSLSPRQYKDCIRSKALNEASHAQLGQLAFHHEV